MRCRAYLLAAVALISACAGPWLQFEPVPQQHRVRAGESLYQLAFRYRLDPRALAQWNGIGRDAQIYAGLDLRLRPPLPGQLHPVHGAARSPSASRGHGKKAPTRVASAPARPVRPRPAPAKPAAIKAGAWRWPVRGQLLRRFGQGSDGIDIGTESGTPVRAAAKGRVVYGGSALKGYGLLLILQHEGEWMSAYAHTAELLVGEGDEVQAGQVIARSGLGPSQTPLLHFEARRQGQPVDPLPLLAGG